MATESPIEFDILMSATRWSSTAQNHTFKPKNCDFLHIFHNFYV